MTNPRELADARSRYSTAASLSALSSSFRPEVRYAVATNPRTDMDTLKVLVTDAEPDVSYVASLRFLGLSVERIRDALKADDVFADSIIAACFHYDRQDKTYKMPDERVWKALRAFGVMNATDDLDDYSRPTWLLMCEERMGW